MDSSDNAEESELCQLEDNEMQQQSSKPTLREVKSLSTRELLVGNSTRYKLCSEEPPIATLPWITSTISS